MEINFDQRKKIAFPRFHHYDYAIRYIAEQALGLRYIQLPPATKATVELGSKYSPDYACAPFKHTLGSLIEALEAGADIVVETGGLCRLDYYGELQREILKELGYHFEFINLAEYMGGKKKEWLKLAKELSPRLKPAKSLTEILEGIKMAEYMDEMEALYYQKAGYEAEKGSFRKVMDQFYLDMQMADTKEEIKNGYQKGKSEMNRLEIQIPERPIRIGVVGEYFTVMDAHANQHLH